MASLNKLALQLTNTTVDEYETYCIMNDLPTYKTDTKKSYFKAILSGQIVRNKTSGMLKLVKKRKRRK